MTNRRELITLGGALVGALVFPFRLPRQWFVTSISGYVILLGEGQGMYQWLEDIEDDYPSLKEVTGNVFWHRPHLVSSKYDHWPRWKLGDGHHESSR